MLLLWFLCISLFPQRWVIKVSRSCDWVSAAQPLRPCVCGEARAERSDPSSAAVDVTPSRVWQALAWAEHGWSWPCFCRSILTLLSFLSHWHGWEIGEEWNTDLFRSQGKLTPPPFLPADFFCSSRHKTVLHWLYSTLRLQWAQVGSLLSVWLPSLSYPFSPIHRTCLNFTDKLRKANSGKTR